MKYLTLVSVSIVCLSSIATTSVRAGTSIDRSIVAIANTKTVLTKITPFQLVSLAYQGQYRRQGIPGFATLISAYYSRTITAIDVVKAAIQADELTPDALTDRDYIGAVDLQLNGLDRPD